MAVIVECDQLVGAMDIENNAGAEHEETYPEHAGKYRDEEPVADVREDLPLAPPGCPGVAGPETGEDREYDRQRNGDRDHLHDGLSDHHENVEGQVGHDRLVATTGPAVLPRDLRSREIADDDTAAVDRNVPRSSPGIRIALPRIAVAIMRSSLPRHFRSR